MAEVSRIRRFNGWKDFALFLAEILGAATIIGGFVSLLLTSLGFKVSGAGDEIATLKIENLARDAAISRVSSRVDTLTTSQRPVMYMVCVLFAESHPRQVPSECGSAVRSRGQ